MGRTGIEPEANCSTSDCSNLLPLAPLSSDPVQRCLEHSVIFLVMKVVGLELLLHNLKECWNYEVRVEGSFEKELGLNLRPLEKMATALNTHKIQSYVAYWENNGFVLTNHG